MTLEVYFTFEEKIDYLRKHGYEIGKRKELMWWNVYHNDTEEEEVEIWFVRKNGKDYNHPSRNNYGSQEWVENVFNDEIRAKLRAFVLAL